MLFYICRSIQLGHSLMANSRHFDTIIVGTFAARSRAMKRVISHCKQFLQRKDGASGIEYAVIAAMVAEVLAGLSGGISSAITTTFTAIRNAL